MTEVSQAEFARLKSVSKKTVTEWKQQGRLTMVGKLVDVEASQLLLKKGSSHKAAGKLRPVTPAVTLATEVTLQVTKPVAVAAYFNGAEYDNPANLPNEIVTVSSVITVGAYDLALLIGRHLPMPLVRELVAEWGTRQRQDWAGGADLPDSNADVDWPAPPIGFARWSDHPLFTDPLLQEHEWAEIKAGIAKDRAL